MGVPDKNLKDEAMNKFRYSYFQLTFGQDEAYLHPEWSYARLARCGYDAIEIAPPKGRHLYFRDSNSLTPGYGKTDFKAVMRALKKTGYSGYCTIESAPMIPDADTAARHGIDYLQCMERIAEYQISPEFPNGYALSNT